MKNINYWDRFAKTGNISDYLNYIACTSEESTQYIAKENEEGGYRGDSITCDGDSLISHANWRV
ncbi:MAG: hypothetical protein K0S41_718 [Anaerocolumna sp.]|jgi:hypothetical protein|nr:hypothetical protein [Anaerocolumna sp.]